MEACEKEAVETLGSMLKSSDSKPAREFRSKRELAEFTIDMIDSTLEDLARNFSDMADESSNPMYRKGCRACRDLTLKVTKLLDAAVKV